MRILLLALDVVLDTYRGEAVHTRELARFLGLRRHEVNLATATPQERLDGLPANVVHHSVAGLGDFSAVRRLAGVARRTHAQVIYERRLSPKIACVTSRLTGIPFVFEVNGTEDEPAMQGRSSPGAFRPIKVRLRGYMYRRAARIVAVTEGLGRSVRERYQVDHAAVEIIPNGVDSSLFRPQDHEAARKAVGWAPGRWIVFVGNLVPWQGIETLLRALPRVLESVPDASVAIVGDGLLGPSLKALAVALGVADRVRFIGMVPHESIPTYVSAATVCAAPFTRIRNADIGLSPLKIYEYLACGRPVVASDIPGVDEILRSSHAGLVVPPDDPGSLSRSLIEVLTNSALAENMGRDGREYAAAECSWDRTAERVEGVLMRAVAA